MIGHAFKNVLGPLKPRLRSPSNVLLIAICLCWTSCNAEAEKPQKFSSVACTSNDPGCQTKVKKASSKDATSDNTEEESDDIIKVQNPPPAPKPPLNEKPITPEKVEEAKPIDTAMNMPPNMPPDMAPNMPPSMVPNPPAPPAAVSPKTLAFPPDCPPLPPMQPDSYLVMGQMDGVKQNNNEVRDINADGWRVNGDITVGYDKATHSVFSEARRIFTTFFFRPPANKAFKQNGFYLLIKSNIKQDIGIRLWAKTNEEKRGTGSGGAETTTWMQVKGTPYSTRFTLDKDKCHLLEFEMPLLTRPGLYPKVGKADGLEVEVKSPDLNNSRISYYAIMIKEYSAVD